MPPEGRNPTHLNDLSRLASQGVANLGLDKLKYKGVVRKTLLMPLTRWKQEKIFKAACELSSCLG